MTEGRTLVLSVDRDDDIGWKAKIESPVVGRQECLKAADTLALADPEDSDVNAIFSAVKIYDELIAKGEEAIVAVIAGNHLHMIEGDRKIAATLEDVIKETKPTSCILVSDGAEDEYVIPIIQSRLPVASIRRVIVNQMPNLEGTYYILKKLLDDPKISTGGFRSPRPCHAVIRERIHPRVSGNGDYYCHRRDRDVPAV